VVHREENLRSQIKVVNYRGRADPPND